MPTPEASATAEILSVAESTIARADKKRQELATDMAAGSFHIDPLSLGPVLRAQAAALPWRQVRAEIQSGLAPVAALLDVRAELTRRLLSMSEGVQADGLLNEFERMEREASRDFLRLTARFAKHKQPSA
ncbi:MULTISPECIES: hypothetical protein [Streptomycetaceae]|uniref:Uncharacterized protein n=1 Tax=Streptantibioticus cattleyicolor (strain ATCC 35852 / DSM 46488 / JCM 4925 / NBRC 14057 / NRRL 8057) TaxID=1003195 RepID=G8WRG3_STREN|nr:MULTISPECIES: hypothetical protein [Streptomycetaceae]AEW92980.1 hypothetical protein SCATT_06090 [Streptantibioticus cattleyicolor NRRL 8057 = DSM 46488]MYS57722.1 hypothetical protein [Streptomyces sp. SID5468]